MAFYPFESYYFLFPYLDAINKFTNNAKYFPSFCIIKEKVEHIIFAEIAQSP